MKRAVTKRLIERYYYQLTVGCGEVKCDNDLCASSQCFRLRGLDNNAAAAQALSLCKSRSRLCDEPAEKVSCKAAGDSMLAESELSVDEQPSIATGHPKSNNTLSSSQQTPTDRPMAQQIADKIELFCETGSWSPLIGLVGSVFFDPLVLMKSFLTEESHGSVRVLRKQHSHMHTVSELADAEDSKTVNESDESDSDVESVISQPSTSAAAASVGCTSMIGTRSKISSLSVRELDIKAVRLCFDRLFSIPNLPFQPTLISAVHYLSRTVAADLRSAKMFCQLPEFPNLFKIIMEIPALGTLEFIEEAMPQFCKTVGLLPLHVQVNLAKFWSTFEPCHLRNLVSRVQQLITVRVIPHHESGTPSSLVHDDDCITGAACLLKILYYASIYGGKKDSPEIIAVESLAAKEWLAEFGGKDVVRSHGLSEAVADFASPWKEPSAEVWEDPLARELSVHPIDCRQPLVKAEEFVNEMLSDAIEIDKDYTYYRAYVSMNEVAGSSVTSSSSSLKFSYMMHPFLLTTAVKSTGMFVDNRIRMLSERRASLLQNIMHGGHSGGMPYLRLKIRRDHIVDDALNALELVAMENPQDFKKQLFVEFEGEQGIDEGGVSKEFFQLVIEELFNPDIVLSVSRSSQKLKSDYSEGGMFIYSEETQTFWFNASSFENEGQFTLIGIVLGLAMYNGVILDVRFPSIVYRKLLGKHGTFADLKSSHPGLARGLGEMLQYEGCVAEAFEQPFCIAVVDVFGNTQVHNLKDSGDQIIVSNETKQEFVDLYADFLLNKSIDKQFLAFKRGFHMVTSDSPLRSMFRPDEIELLVCGSKNFDFQALEEATRYDGGFRSDSPTVRNFWEVVHSFNEEQKKSLLQFATGSDRIPVGGFSKLKLIIARNGPDSDRLPTSHTCFNILLLPDYCSKDKLKERLVIAITNCKGFGML